MFLQSNCSKSHIKLANDTVDTVDHSILINMLETWVGASGTALDWFVSYLSNRTFVVSIAGEVSQRSEVVCGVLQRSLLGPILFSIYMLPLGAVIRQHNINFQCYADDLQLYLSLRSKDLNSLDVLQACLID